MNHVYLGGGNGGQKCTADDVASEILFGERFATDWWCLNAR